MRSEQITTSAALFCASEQKEAISLEWFEKACEWLEKFNLSPILFTAGGGEFKLDDSYVVADPGGDLVKWGEVMVARRHDLVRALGNGVIYNLGLDSPRAGAVDRSDWRADVSAFTGDGEFYVGIDEDLVSDPVALLRCAYEIAKGLFDVRYGIAYKMPLAEEPDCYASGFAKTSPSEVFEMIRHRREWDLRKKSPDELWADELNGKRRHLTGLFRGAYPASLLSDSHLRTADLRSQGVGKLSELDASLWLWELTESEIPQAEAMLEERKLLVSQASQP